ncbi:MAG: hypothetical protein NTV04_19710 [Deltaproteobacteria bacterium]|nr:hypothetical protein [Deltaproteobacteria bacterium]
MGKKVTIAELAPQVATLFGVRSYKACLKLKHRAFVNVKNVDGGLLCWFYDLE